MKKIQHLLYLWDLRKYPAIIPYENLSQFMTFKLQKQAYYHNLTLKNMFKNLVCKYITSKIKGYYFRLHYYYDYNGDLKNNMTKSTYNCYVLKTKWCNKTLSLKEFI